MERPSNPGRRAVLGAPVAAAALLSAPAMAQSRRGTDGSTPPP